LSAHQQDAKHLRLQRAQRLESFVVEGEQHRAGEEEGHLLEGTGKVQGRYREGTGKVQGEQHRAGEEEGHLLEKSARRQKSNLA
jgi:hypothetical protein